MRPEQNRELNLPNENDTNLMQAQTPGMPSPREAILNRLEAEESHCISRLNRLREAKLQVVMAGDRECSLFDNIHGVFGGKW